MLLNCVGYTIKKLFIFPQILFLMVRTLVSNVPGPSCTTPPVFPASVMAFCNFLVWSPPDDKTTAAFAFKCSAGIADAENKKVRRESITESSRTMCCEYNRKSKVALSTTSTKLNVRAFQINSKGRTSSSTNALPKQLAKK